ncbi:Tol-Pal system protein TolR [Castellaniella defragrans]
MAFGSFDSRQPGTAMSEINMIPLIDVMLVLLVIFIITAPLMSHTIRVNVPQVSAQPADQTPKVIDLAIDAGGTLYWNDHAVALDSLESRFAQEATQDPQPEVHLRADVDTHYGVLAEVMGAARQAGMKRLGFVTRPGTAAPAATSAAPASPAASASSAASTSSAASKPVAR